MHNKHPTSLTFIIITISINYYIFAFIAVVLDCVFLQLLLVCWAIFTYAQPSCLLISHKMLLLW